MLVLSPALLINSEQSLIRTSESGIGLPPPETIHESVKKKKKRFGRRKKKVEVETQEEMNLCPPRFSQMDERTLSLGDNSFDAANAAYNLYAFVVRLIFINIFCFYIWTIEGKMFFSFLFLLLLVPLWGYRWWTLCCLYQTPSNSTMVLFQR